MQARQIFDSRGNPTIEVDVVTELGLFRAAGMCTYLLVIMMMQLRVCI